MADRPPPGHSVLPQLQWGIVDQALSSGTNFVLTVFVVRTVSPEDFGAFSVAFVVYILAIGIARSFNAEPLVISHGGNGAEVQARAGRAMGGAVALGAAFGVACVAAAALLKGSLGGSLLMLGCCLPLLLVQDTGRVLLFALGRARGAAFNDGVWALVQMGILGVLVTTTSADLWQLMAAWLVSGSVTGLLALLQLRVRPQLHNLRSWIRSRRRLGAPLLGAYLLNIAPPYLLFALAPLVAGLSELGLARAAWVPFGPLGVVMQGTALVLLPAIAQRGAARTMDVVVRATEALVALALAWSVTVLLMPDSVGAALLGDNWTDTRTIRVLFAGSLVAQAISLSAVVALGALEAPQRLVRVRAITAPVLLVGGLVLAARAQSVGIAAAILVGDALTAVLSWRELRLVAARRMAAEARPDDAHRAEPAAHGPAAQPGRGLMLSTPRVSALLPVKDADAFFDAAVRSILTQTMSDLELVIVLDGQNAAAEAILADIHDPRIRVVSVRSSRGLAAALNTGLGACRADLVARIDADDVALPERFERQVEELARRPHLGVLGTRAHLIDADGRYIGPRNAPTGTKNVARVLLWRNALVHSSVMVRREIVLRVGGYHEGLRRLEDYELWLRCLPVCEVDNLAEPLLLYRLHPGQHSRGFLLSEEIFDDLRRAKIRAGRSVGARPIGVVARHLLWRAAQVRNRPPIRRLRRL